MTYVFCSRWFALRLDFTAFVFQLCALYAPVIAAEFMGKSLIILQKAYINIFPAGNYMFKVNNRNTRTRCEICSKLTIKIPE